MYDNKEWNGGENENEKEKELLLVDKKEGGNEMNANFAKAKYYWIKVRASEWSEWSSNLYVT